MEIDFSHLHLLLNHLPIIGTMAGTALLLLSFFATTSDVRRSSLIVLVVSSLAVIPVFITGVGSQVQMLARNPAVSNEMIQRHLGAAELSIWFMLATGALAVGGLWQWHRRGQPHGAMVAALLLMSLISAGLVTRTGNTGGEIRHEEVRPAQESGLEGVLASIEPSPPAFTNLMIVNKWWWAFMMGMHFIGLTMIFGTIGLLNLRILGFAKLLPIGPLNKLVPWGLLGIGINVVTGMLAFIGMTSYYAFNIAFFLKIVALILALATMAVFYASSVFRDCAEVGPGQDAPIRAKLIAATSLVLWVGVLYLGRYIQPFENSIPR